MKKDNSPSVFWNLWGMPICLALISLLGLLFAIIGTGIWHLLSWLALSYPVFIMFKYGRVFFYRDRKSAVNK